MQITNKTNHSPKFETQQKKLDRMLLNARELGHLGSWERQYVRRYSSFTEGGASHEK